MAKEFHPKFDPNTEAFQMRAQWKKVDICRKQWFDRWSWLLDERRLALAESEKVRTAAFLREVPKPDLTKSLKPVPATSTGFIGWLAAKLVLVSLLILTSDCVTILQSCRVYFTSWRNTGALTLVQGSKQFVCHCKQASGGATLPALPQTVGNHYL
ncbi:unnamed protein product [Chilo suppressalis]|uniref:Uncharacterized protein n=1 Tax=Chilo suppressalis TaxID=168631 RepID=A0ABN8L3S6_CHISP|nr:unnamed protein product [Chilo suppressalis]